MFNPIFLVTGFYILYLWVSLRESPILWYFTLSTIDPQWTVTVRSIKSPLKRRILHKPHAFFLTISCSWPTMAREEADREAEAQALLALHWSFSQKWAGQTGLLLFRPLLLFLSSRFHCQFYSYRAEEARPTPQVQGRSNSRWGAQLFLHRREWLLWWP